MAKQRMINTKFWSDSWIRQNLNPLDRYLFVYLLTNEHTNICGIYELPIETMAFETGLDKEDLLKSYFPRLKPKVFYTENWVILVNFLKHQNFNSPKVKKGIEIELEAIPSHILDFAKEVRYRMDTISHSNSNSNSNSNSKITPPTPPLSSQSERDVNQVLSIFYNTVNPNISYTNKANRDSAKWLIDKYGLDKIIEATNYAVSVQNDRYAPTITTPSQLKEKMAGLLKYKLGNGGRKEIGL